MTANYTLKTKTPGSLDITKSEIAQYVTLTPVDVVETYDGAPPTPPRGQPPPTPSGKAVRSSTA